MLIIDLILLLAWTLLCAVTLISVLILACTKPKKFFSGGKMKTFAIIFLAALLVVGMDWGMNHAINASKAMHKSTAVAARVN